MVLEDELMGAKRHCYDQIKVDMADFERKLSARLSRQGASKKKSRRLLIPIVSGFCMLATVTVASAALEPIKWNGWNITIGAADPIEALKESLFPAPDARDWMNSSISKATQSYTLQQAIQAFPFEISRPTTGVLPLVKTVALEVPTNSFVVWDEYEQGRDWVVVRQTHSILDSNGGNATFVGGQPVTVGNGTFAVISKHPGGLQLLTVYLKNSQNQNIELMLEGNIGQGKLIEIAKSYFPK